MIRCLRALLERVRRDERGISLVELLIAMGLFTVLLAIVGGTFVSITRATTFAAARDQNTRSAQNGMNELMRQFRGAADNPVANAADDPAFQVATPTSVTMWSLVATGRDAVPQVVTFSVTNGSLVETITPSRASGSYYVQGTIPTQRTLLDGVTAAPTGGTPLFTYLAADGSPVGGGGALTLAQRSMVRSVTITLTVANTRSALSNGIVLQNTVGLPNQLDQTQGVGP